MKVVVTGGSGAVGGPVLAELKQAGYEVVNLDRHRPDGWVVRYAEVDLNDFGQVQDAIFGYRPDAIVHLAGDPHPHRLARHGQFVSNLAMTHAILQIAADLGVKPVVIASSERANGWSSRHLCPPRIPFGEEDVILTANGYAMSKSLGESLADGYAAEYPDMRIVSLRLNFVLTGHHYEHIHRQAAAFPAGHSNLWGYVDGRDAAAAVRLAIERGRPGHRAYMVAAADSMTETPTREAVHRHFGPEITVAADLPEFGSAIDCTRIQTELGWEPKHTWRHQNQSV